jgi:hypothetical protein
VSIADISPIPGPSNVPKNRPKRHKSKKLKSEILSVTAMKEKLEEAERRRSNKCSKKVFLKQVKQKKKGRTIKKALFGSSSDDNIDENKICDDDSDGSNGFQNYEENNTNELCSICREFGRDNELRFQCVSCSGWTHGECRGEGTPKDYFHYFCFK